jgi:hypothetical protein
VATLRWYERYRRTTRTGPDGRYELTGLGAVAHGIQAYREGYKVKRGPDVPKGDVTPDATVDFTGERFVLLGVEIVMPDGKPAEKAWLQLRGPESSRGSGWSAESPWVEVRPGTYEIEAVAGERREYTSAKHTVRVDADVEPEPVRLQLEAQRGLRVRVKLAEGLTARQFCVECVRFTGPEPPGLWALRTTDHIRRAPGTASASSRERELWLADLEPGRYLVGVHHGNYHFTAHAVAEIGDGATDLVLDVARPDPAECFTVRALGPDGDFERHASVHVSIETKDGGHGGGGTVLYDVDGTMYCAYPFWDRKRFGEIPDDARYVATVGTRDLGRRTVEFAREPGAALEVRFAAAATLHVAIADFEKSEHRDGLRVTLHQTGTGPVAWWQPLTAEGTRDFEKLQPGRYRLVLHLLAGQLDRWPIAAHDLELEPGANEFRLKIPHLYSLEVVVETPRDGLRVTLEGGEGNERFSIRRGVSADGLVRFTGIAAGNYTLYCEDRQYPVTVPTRARFQIR